MTEPDLQQIEAALGFTLPASYRGTVLSYPFAAGSFADEFMLPNRPQAVIDLGGVDFVAPGIDRPFFLGSDGGEELYFMDASKPDSGVYVLELETGKHRVLSPSWAAYLAHLQATHAEIAGDEEAERQRAKEKKWWQFWR